MVHFFPDFDPHPVHAEARFDAVTTQLISERGRVCDDRSTSWIDWPACKFPNCDCRFGYQEESSHGCPRQT